MSPGARDGELRLAPESIEALAVRLAEILRGEGAEARTASSDMIPASEVSRRWGVARRWVYDHRDDLGAIEMGDGPRPRLRFDPVIVARRLGAPGRNCRPGRADMRRSTWVGASRISDSLSPRPRAMVRPSREFRAGGGA